MFGSNKAYSSSSNEYFSARAVGMIIIYTIIFLKSVCQRSQTAGHNSCSIVSGNVSNCSHHLIVYILSRVCVSIRPSICFIRENIQNFSEYCAAHASGELNISIDAANCGHGSSPPTSQNGNELSVDNILWSRLICSRTVGMTTTWTATTAVKTATTRVYTFAAWKNNQQCRIVF